MAGSGEKCEWEERLQDWIDGDVDASESEAVFAHAAPCASCGERIEALRTLDAQLARCLPPLALDEGFDRRVLTGVGGVPRDLASARSRIEREWQDQQEALRRGQRRVWNWIILDAAAISLLIALATTSWPLPDAAAWSDRLLALTPDTVWSASLLLAAASTAVALAIVGLLATIEHGER